MNQALLKHLRPQAWRLKGGAALAANCAAVLILATSAYAQTEAPAVAVPEAPTASAVAPPEAATPAVIAAPVTPAKVEQPHQSIALGLTGRTGLQRTSAFAVDHTGAQSSADVEWATRLRARLEATSPERSGHWQYDAVIAVDLLDGLPLARSGLDGDKLPGQRFQPTSLQEAWIGGRMGKKFGVRVGAMTSHWGSGLVANDGAASFSTDRNDWFSLSRSGDRVMRALVFSMPWADHADSPLRGLLFTAAADRVLDDDSASLTLGERANQGSLTARMFLDKTRWIGLYYAHRQQQHDNGKSLVVNVVDAALDLDYRDAETRKGLRIEAEAAWIMGHTTLSPSPEFPVHNINQLGAFGRVTHKMAGGLTLQMDAGYFSGDANYDDRNLNAFRADRNFRQGLILFERVLGWQTGRARITASNLNVVGVPNQDLDRLASDGAVFNAITAFPKIGLRFADDHEIFGGVLLAMSPVSSADPYLTKTQKGGSPINYLGQVPTGWLGTEIDIGYRWYTPLPETMKGWLMVGLEGGVLLPGGGIGNASPITTGRITLGLLNTK